MGEDDTCDQKSMTAGCIPCGLFVLFFCKAANAAIDWNSRSRFLWKELETVFNSAKWLS
jgi:hypothetical protein